MTAPLPKTARGRARQEQILDAALEAFATRGYRTVSMATIASTVGLTEQGVLHYFPSKEALLLGVLQLRDRRDSARMAQLSDGLGLSATEKILEVMRHNVTEPGLATLFSVLMAESVHPAHPGHEWFKQRNRRLRSELEAWLDEDRSQGRIRADVDIGAASAQVIALFDGLALQWSIDPEGFDMVDVMAAYVAGLEA